MTFDELRRRHLSRKGSVISSNDSQAEASRLRDPAFSESALEDLDEAEMNRFLECLEGTLLIDDLGQHEA